MEQDAVRVWKQACAHLREALSKDVYDRWIAVIVAKEISDNTLLLGVANDFYQSWLEENYLPLISNAIAAVCGAELGIKLVVDRAAAASFHSRAAEASSVKKGSPATEKRTPAKTSKKPFLNTKYTFHSYIVGPSNNFAHAASMAVAQSPAKAYNPLFIYGGVGLGKTHLMQAIGNHAWDKTQSNIRYLSCEAFTNDYIDALQKKGLTQFRKKYRNIDVLLIDDIHFLAGKERMQEEFFHTFNALFENHKQIVLTSDRPASEIPGLEHRLVSRFEWGLVTELESPDIETRIAILRNKQSQMNLDLPDEIILFIAENIRSNIRRLEGALIRVASYASLTGRELGIEKIEKLLRDTLDQEQEQSLSIEAIQRIVADHYDLRLGDMTSRRRPQSVAFPRQIAMFLCRDLTENSLPTIGNAFGRNHATVIHACRLVTDKMNSDPKIRQAVSALRHRIGHK
ncbi:MAG: chromosomal replication initiator protein DnaA [Verrucomicrobia bacterium]|nr:chromosomal replication initiator protein DnaA [Verrucomicrobiota bacterium]